MNKDKNETAEDTVSEEENAANTVNENTESQIPDLQEDNTKLEADKLRAEKQGLQDKYLRLLAEFENYKKRTVRERLDLLNTASKDTLAALLPVLDDFDRAQNLTEEQKNTPAFQEGIQLVYQKLNNVVKQRGLEAMESTVFLLILNCMKH